MSKSLRLSERWFNRGLWLVALLFAVSLAGLGSAVVGDLPQVERQLSREDFLDQAAAQPLRAEIRLAVQAREAADDRLDTAKLKHTATRQAYRSARESFENWLQTRTATGLASQDQELIARSKLLDALKTEEDAGQSAVDAQQQIILAAEQARSNADAKLDVLGEAAGGTLRAAEARAELRVFLYRLALTLPLLVIAGWLFARHRNGTWWPFVWGFVLFALYSFFVELVPYLPSYGGYVRYTVGVIITVLVGRYVIVSLNRYLALQKLAEQQPEQQRRETLAYDTALIRLSKNVCPSCERGVDLGSADKDFCPHCGIGLFNHCGVCNTRKNAFSQFCISCGTPAQGEALHTAAGVS